jgi:hypothetical protein
VSGHVFVDETKHRGYLIVASVVMPGDLDRTRKLLRSLVLPGQRRLHMKDDESGPRKRTIATAIIATGIRTTVYDAATRYRTERDRRAACLRAVVDDAAGRADTLLVLEQDDTLLAWDNQRLIEFTRAAGCRDTLRYEHRRAAAEELLAIPDAIAWCWAKGGDWHRRVGSGGRSRPSGLTRVRKTRSPSAAVVRPGLGLLNATGLFSVDGRCAPVTPATRQAGVRAVRAWCRRRLFGGPVACGTRAGWAGSGTGHSADSRRTDQRCSQSNPSSTPGPRSEPPARRRSAGDGAPARGGGRCGQEGVHVFRHSRSWTPSSRFSGQRHAPGCPTDHEPRSSA